jgi:hypothetical protein
LRDSCGAFRGPRIPLEKSSLGGRQFRAGIREEY